MKIIDAMLENNHLLNEATFLIDRYLTNDIMKILISIIEGDYLRLFKEFVRLHFTRKEFMTELYSFVEVAIKNDAHAVFKYLVKKSQNTILDFQYTDDSHDIYDIIHVVLKMDALKIYKYLQIIYAFTRELLYRHAEFSIKVNSAKLAEYFMKKIKIDYSKFINLPTYLFQHQNHNTLEVVFKNFDFSSQYQLILRAFDSNDIFINEYLYKKGFLDQFHFKALMQLDEIPVFEKAVGIFTEFEAQNIFQWSMELKLRVIINYILKEWNVSINIKDMCTMMKADIIDDYRDTINRELIDFNAAIDCAIENNIINAFNQLLLINPQVDKSILKRIIQNNHEFIDLLIKHKSIPEEILLNEIIKEGDVTVFKGLLKKHNVNLTVSQVESIINSAKIDFLVALLTHNPRFSFFQEYNGGITLRQYIIRYSQLSSDKRQEIIKVLSK
ncbi:hypothetical protein ROZALSC1DRAFT_30286 [Rozella allomycis CSF55]|uniref:Uncharacterized protein n=1 Tax=Rozella allomycis (strain CSF55) TaxID=988480 RepID=A0A4P9YFM1_ROZAC|nr:hypothetical protein ROZALSC1DRAFT_30286 [Rozella allomycis CSF55]